MIDATKSNEDTLFKELTTLVADKALNDKFGNASDATDRSSSVLANALTVARDQELHSITMLQEAEKLKGQTLKNQMSEQKLEIDLAKAASQGLATNIQDPKPLGTQVQQTMQGVQWPSESALTTRQNPNVTKTILDEVVTAQQQRRVRQGERPDTVSELSKQDEWIREQILTRIEKLDSEKHLSRSPLGQIGSLFGGVLDIISGPLDIGTAIFGGTVPEDVKVGALTRMLSYVGPHVRAEMEDLRYRDKMEMTASKYIKSRGYGDAVGLLSSDADMQTADEITSIGMEIRQSLQDGIASSFGSEAVTGVGDAFAMFENIKIMVEQLKEARTDEEAEYIKQKIFEADSLMRKPIQQYLANGGTIEKVKQDIQDAKNLVKAKYQQPFEPTPGDQYASKYKVRKRVVSKSFTDKLTELYYAVAENAPLDMQIAERSALGERGYEQKKKYSGAVKGNIQTNVALIGDPSSVGMGVPIGWKDIGKVVDVAKESSGSLKDELDKLRIPQKEFTKLKQIILDDATSSKEERAKLRKLLIEYENKRYKAK